MKFDLVNEVNRRDELISEKEFYPLLKRLFGDDYFVTSEVRFGSKSIDVVCVSPEMKQVLAIEMKVSDWRKALHQALTYQLCADESYVALHRRYCSNIDRSTFERYGIGLIAIDDYASIELPAKPSPRISPSYVTALKREVGTRLGVKQSTTLTLRPSPVGFYLWYIPLDKRYFEDFPDYFDGFVINAHILEHNASAFTALITKLNKSFFALPDTHAFQFAPLGFFLDSKGGIRTSWEKLARSYGNLIRMVLSQGRNVTIDDFLSTTGSFEQTVYDLAANVVAFQKRRTVAAAVGLSRFLDRPSKETAPKKYLVAPYFHFTSLNDPWYKISLEMTREAVKHKEDYELFAVLCTSSSVLLSDALSTIARDYSLPGLDGFLVWIRDFREEDEPVPMLVGLKKLVRELKSTGKAVINIHGGFFSAALHHCGLDGFACGVCYKDAADPTEFPTGGPPGGAVPKYYLAELRIKLPKIDAALALKELPGLQCSCSVCTGQTQDMFDISSPDQLSKELMNRHFLNVRQKEMDEVANNTLSAIVKRIEAAYSKYEIRRDILRVDHLNRWKEALSEE